MNNILYSGSLFTKSIIPHLIIIIFLFFTYRTLVKKLPNSLIVHLKRFKYEEHTKRMVKLSHRIAFPSDIRLKAVSLCLVLKNIRIPLANFMNFSFFLDRDVYNDLVFILPFHPIYFFRMWKMAMKKVMN